MENNFEQRLKGFESVWKRVTESKDLTPKPVKAELMPKKKNKSRAVRFGAAAE